MNIYDSVQKKKIKFTPIVQGEARVYICGPTVYDDAHLGHARSAISFDILRRVLIAQNYNVIFVKNFTDIDDKIIAKMVHNKESLEQFTSRYKKRYKEDMHALNVNDADIEPNATDNIAQMANFVQSLLDNKIAYQIDDGIYFDTKKDNKYLTISNQNIEEHLVVNRINTNKQKKNFKDFALWKYSKTQPTYMQSFGDGRPGWHLECSAMIDHHLAYKGKSHSIDIHCGGADLLFPHHENEAAQSRCVTGVELAKYWMHNGFVNVNGNKMSKSLGNSFFIKDALKSYHGEVLRFYLLSTHYRSNFSFNEDDLLVSKRRLDKLYRLKKRVYNFSNTLQDNSFEASLLDSMSDDMNISVALAHIDEFVTLSNESLDINPNDKLLKQKINSNIKFISSLLGVGYEDCYKYFQFGIEQSKIVLINSLIKQRLEAKSSKNFEVADRLREELNSMGIAIMDTPTSTLWEII